VYSFVYSWMDILMVYLIEGKLQFYEYFDAHKTAARIRRTILRTAAVVGGLFVIILNFTESFDGSMLLNWQSSIGISLIIYGVVISPLQFRYRVKRNWIRYPAVHKQLRLLSILLA
jgi:hypothetical protein